MNAALAAFTKRPGRRGHHPDFLDAIANRYRELRAQGERAPVKQIAIERGVSRNTAAGWIRQARQRVLLRPASPRRSR